MTREQKRNHKLAIVIFTLFIVSAVFAVSAHADMFMATPTKQTVTLTATAKPILLTSTGIVTMQTTSTVNYELDGTTPNTTTSPKFGYNVVNHTINTNQYYRQGQFIGMAGVSGNRVLLIYQKPN